MNVDVTVRLRQLPQREQALVRTCATRALGAIGRAAAAPKGSPRRKLAAEQADRMRREVGVMLLVEPTTLERAHLKALLSH